MHASSLDLPVAIPALSPTPADPAAYSMEHIFAPLRQPWVWDFFFDSTHQEADQLHYAITDQLVTLADFDISTTDTLDPYADRYRVHEKHRILLLPSFSTGVLTVGFGVNERLTSSNSFVSRERYTGRIVRDDCKGTTLFIAEDENINMVEVSFLNLFSPARREQWFMLFKRDKFRSAIASIRHTYKHAALCNALMYCYHTVEGRACPSCGGHVSCTCVITVMPKKHPLDRDTEMLNLVSYTGNYNGVASLSLYNKGLNVFLANYDAKSGISIRADFSTQQKLALWAVCAASQKRRVNPLRLIMTEAAAMKDRAVTATDTFLLSSLADSVMANASLDLGLYADTDGNEFLDSDASADGASLTAGAQSASNTAMAAATGMLSDGAFVPGIGVGGALAHVAAMPGMLGSTDALTGLSGVMSSVGVGANVRSTAVSTTPSVSENGTVSVLGVDPEFDAQMEGTKDIYDAMDTSDLTEGETANVQNSAVTRTPDTRPESASISASASASASAAASAQTPTQTPATAGVAGPQMAPATGTDVRPKESEAGAKRVHRGLLPLAPRVAIGMESKGENDRQDDQPMEGVESARRDTPVIVDERQRKLEARKARNRESAQRSNQRRKERIRMLRDDIDETSTREAILRAREKVLREENKSLRSAAALR